MPHSIEWLVDDHVIYARLYGDQTLDELSLSNETMMSYLEGSDAPLVHILVNDNELNHVPVSIAQIRKQLTFATHEKLGWVIMVGDKKPGAVSALQEFMSTMLAKLTRARFIRVKTMEEAIQHLGTVDTSINLETIPFVREN